MARLLSGRAAAALRTIVETAKQDAAQAPEAAVECNASGRKKVLVAEDNLVNQLVIKTFISIADYEIFLAENGEQAVDLFKKHAPDIVLMDLSMPVLGGLEATEQIRLYEASEKLTPAPIIATTAHVMQEDRDRCAAAGMDDFLPKPIKKAALDEVMTKWLKLESDRVRAAGA
jgi:osomolarity two-component system sensor histidine kinase NIK1